MTEVAVGALAGALLFSSWEVLSVIILIPLTHVVTNIGGPQ